MHLRDELLRLARAIFNCDEALCNLLRSSYFNFDIEDRNLSTHILNYTTRVTLIWL